MLLKELFIILLLSKLLLIKLLPKPRGSTRGELSASVEPKTTLGEVLLIFFRHGKVRKQGIHLGDLSPEGARS
jgi:hypothetical protein